MDFEKIFAKLISPFRGILSIFVRHAVGHIFVFLSFLFIASRFLPSEIGLYHSVLSLALSISVIGCFRLDVAVFQIKKSSIQGLFRNSFFLISCNSLIIFLASFMVFLSIKNTLMIALFCQCLLVPQYFLQLSIIGFQTYF